MSVNTNSSYGTRPFENALGDRISDLREKHGESQSDMAAALNLSQRATIEQWEKGTRFIKAGQLAEIARHFHVSADYLLGLSPEKSPEMEVQAIYDFLGLSGTAVNYLRTLRTVSQLPPKSNRLQVLSALLEEKQFDLFLALCEKYVDLLRMTTSLSYSQSAEYIFHSDELKKHGFVVSMPDEQANALFSERIINILRELLDGIAGAEEAE